MMLLPAKPRRFLVFMVSLLSWRRDTIWPSSCSCTSSKSHRCEWGWYSQYCSLSGRRTCNRARHLTSPHSELTMTDANLILRYIIPDYFPCIFGPKEDQSLDINATRDEFQKLARQINSYRKKQDPSTKDMTVEEIAQGFMDVANETMCRLIRQLTEIKGHETMNHALACSYKRGALERLLSQE